MYARPVYLICRCVPSLSDKRCLLLAWTTDSLELKHVDHSMVALLVDHHRISLDSFFIICVSQGLCKIDKIN